MVGTSKQRKKDKNSNHNIVNGGSAAASSPRYCYHIPFSWSAKHHFGLVIKWLV